MANNRKGFTLVEVVIALAIVAFMVGLGIQLFIGSIDESKVVKAQAEASTLELAMVQYNIDHPKEQLTTIDIDKLVAANLLQHAPQFKTGDNTCTYSWATYNNGSFVTTEKHVVLSNCTFATDKIITAEGVF